MMEVLIFCAVWLVMGVIGSALTLEFFHRRGSEPMDIDVGDLLFSAAMSLAGPFNLVCGVVFFLGWVVRRSVDTDHVVFRRHGW